jgi:hypothetical protein
MNSTLLCLALLVPGYGEKDIVKRIEAAGGQVGWYEFTPPRVPGMLVVRMATATTDKDLDELCELRDLGFLCLPYSKITDKGVRKVAALRNLTVLQLDGTAITDAGLRQLEGMNNLGGLDLVDCHNITDAGVTRLQKALPNCRIRY